MRYGVRSSISCCRLIPRVRRVISRTCVLNLSSAFGAMRRLLPSFEMLNSRNLRSSGRATALFASLTFSCNFWGTPQGGPISPLLSNLVLDDLDKELTRQGHRFCRYADDANIYVRSRRVGERVMASVSRFLTNKLRLKVNEAKSAVARPEERKFLGFSIANDGSERRIAPKALDKFKTQIRDRTRRTRGISLPQLIEQLTPYLIGWRGYFGFCQTPRVLTNLEAWIRRRLRAYLWRQWQNGHNRFNELRQRGVPKFSAAVAAGSPTGFWRMSGHPAVQQALRNHYFDSLGLPRLYVSVQA